MKKKIKPKNTNLETLIKSRKVTFYICYIIRYRFKKFRNPRERYWLLVHSRIPWKCLKGSQSQGCISKKYCQV